MRWGAQRSPVSKTLLPARRIWIEKGDPRALRVARSRSWCPPSRAHVCAARWIWPPRLRSRTVRARPPRLVVLPRAQCEPSRKFCRESLRIVGGRWPGRSGRCLLWSPLDARLTGSSLVQVLGTTNEVSPQCVFCPLRSRLAVASVADK